MCFGLHASWRKQAAVKRVEGRGVGVHRSGGAHAGRGLSQAQPMGCCLPVKPSLLSGIESLSLPVDQTGRQLTSWWCNEAKLHTLTLIHTLNIPPHTLVKMDTNAQSKYSKTHSL